VHCLFLECRNDQAAKLAAPLLGMDGYSSQDSGVFRGHNQSTGACSLAIDPQQHVDRPVIQTIVIQLGRDTLLPDKDLMANGFGCGQIFGCFHNRDQRPATVFPSIARVHWKTALCRLYLFCLRAFLALGDNHGHFLAFLEGFEAVNLDSGMVHKHIRSFFTLDKPKTFVVVEPLDGTCNFVRHINLYLLLIFVRKWTPCRIFDATRTAHCTLQTRLVAISGIFFLKSHLKRPTRGFRHCDDRGPQVWSAS
jgi:hypothetical protein